MSALLDRAKPYMAYITAAGARWKVSPALIIAVIAQESNFNPRALRNEPAIGDASTGLMQLLLKTAAGLGFKGNREALYDPQTNIDLGAHYLAQLEASKGGDVAAAVSAYNNGNGNRAATDVLGYVIARDQVTGKATQTRNVKKGEFYNQPYVDAVMANYTSLLSSPLPAASTLPIVAPDGSDWRTAPVITAKLPSSGAHELPPIVVDGNAGLSTGVKIAIAAGIGITLLALFGRGDR